jgi:riboflavin biosynthesis pyrimidine reductase
MAHHVFSMTLELPARAGLHVVAKEPERVVRELRAARAARSTCAAGASSRAWLLERELIDRLVVKLNPILLGRGLSPFARQVPRARLQRTDVKSYPNGVVLLRYDVAYA